MAAEGLQIKISADVQQAITNINKFNSELINASNATETLGLKSINILNNQLERLQRLAANPNLSTEQYQRLGSLISKTSKEVNVLNNSLLILNRNNSNTTQGTNQATVALTNFSRVASDAPFGLIGIANNIDPLVQSFIALRKETGSGKAALSALTASLTGGGGLIIAVSLITSALQFAQLGFSRWGASAQKVKEDQDKLKQGTDQLVTTITKQRVEFEALVNIAKSANNTENERAQALERLNKILPDTIGKLTAQNIATQEGARITREYIKAIEGRATAELLINRIAENNVKLFDNRNNALQKSSEIENKLVELRAKYNKALTATIPNYQVIEAFSAEIENNESRRNQIQKEGRDIASQILADNQKLRAEYERQLPATNALALGNEKAQKSASKATNEIVDLLKQYNEQLKGINWDEQNRQIDGTKKRLELAGETLKTLYLAGVKETSAAWIRVKADFDQFQSAFDKFVRDKRLAEINAGVQEYTNNIGSYTEKALGETQKKVIKALNETGKLFLENYKAQQKALSDLQKKNEELANTISGFLSPALESVFEAVVKGEDPFEVLQNSVKQLVIELGKAVIKSLILKAVTSAIGGPAAGAAVSGTGLATMRGDVFSFLLSRGR